MDNINFKKVLDDGELFNQQANYEDNFEKINQLVVPKITDLETNKVDKVAGKGLSTNDFDNTYKQKIDVDIPAQLNDIENDFNAQLAEIVQVPMSKLSRAVVGNIESLKGWNKDFTGRLHIAVLGDSISEGAWADADPLKWNLYKWVSKLRQALSEVYGYGGEGFLSMGGSYTKIVRTGAWTNNADFAPHGNCYYAVGETNYVTISNVYGDILDVFYVNNSAVTFKVSVDGEADQLITSAAPYNNQSVVATIALGAVGNHTIVIKGATTGTLFLQGAAIYIGTTGVVIHDFSRSGATVYAGASYKMTTRFTPLNVIQPKLSFLNFLANDYNYQSTANNFLATYSTNMLAVVNFLKGIGSKVLVWQPPDNNVVPTATTWTTEEYEQASIGSAKSANVAWLNIHEHWGEYADNTAKMYDTQHPNKRGHLDIARVIESVISQ